MVLCSDQFSMKSAYFESSLLMHLSVTNDTQSLSKLILHTPFPISLSDDLKLLDYFNYCASMFTPIKITIVSSAVFEEEYIEVLSNLPRRLSRHALLFVFS